MLALTLKLLLSECDDNDEIFVVTEEAGEFPVTGATYRGSDHRFTMYTDVDEEEDA